MKKVSANAFAVFLRQRAAKKDGYIMGATGQNPKNWSANSWWFTQYKGKQKTRALYWRSNAERVWDCQGLAEGYYKDMTGDDINTRARYNYSGWCNPKGKGLIPPKRRVPGAAVFWGDKPGSITHVAFLVSPVNASDPGGDWIMVEARGVMYGVAESRLLSRKPEYWGLMTKYFDYSGAEGSPEIIKKPEESDTATVKSGTWNIRTGPGTGYASTEIVKGGDKVTPIDIGGWQPILRDGQIVYISKNALREEK